MGYKNSSRNAYKYTDMHEDSDLSLPIIVCLVWV